jgi:hypothetical protein
MRARQKGFREMNANRRAPDLRAGQRVCALATATDDRQNAGADGTRAVYEMADDVALSAKVPTSASGQAAPHD